jgi:hypothetical protein
MNTQLKKKPMDLGLNSDEKFSRPNIDHLIKRIMTERKRERKNNIVTIILIFSVILIIFLWFL